jgi:hypothetical protein
MGNAMVFSLELSFLQTITRRRCSSAQTLRIGFGCFARATRAWCSPQPMAWGSQ